MSLRFSCFSGWEEWCLVYHGLFSLEPSRQRKAIDIVHVWRSRGGLPSSAESTAQLVEANLQDQFSSLHPEQLRLILSIAVLRAVNLIVEPNQVGFYAEPVVLLAQRAGIPGWIVELRHEATHKLLPSLSVLRSAAQFLLKWYKENYWEKQYEAITSKSLLCVQCMSHSQKSKRAHKEISAQVAKGPAFFADAVVPTIITSIDSEVKQLCSEAAEIMEESESCVENMEERVRTSASDLFQQWETFISILMNDNAEAQNGDRFSRERIQVPLICGLLTLADNCDNNLVSFTRLVMINAWVSKLLQLGRPAANKGDLESCDWPNLNRQFISTSVSKLNQFLHKPSQPFSTKSRVIAQDTLDELQQYFGLSTDRAWGIKETLSNTNKQVKSKTTTSQPAKGSDALMDMERWLTGLRTKTDTEVDTYEASQPTKRQKVHHGVKLGIWPIGLVPGDTNSLELLNLVERFDG